MTDLDAERWENAAAHARDSQAARARLRSLATTLRLRAEDARTEGATDIESELENLAGRLAARFREEALS